MPSLIIDDIAVTVSEGTTVLEAAQAAGITIPHFCWHPALGKAGACRVCAVKMVEGPVKGLQMSCMLPAQDGMVVSTTDPEAMAMRKSVIEWLMINHPHDCPVCDEGGECQLQDFTIAGGHGLRRYDGLKRTYTNQYLGEQIEHEMNRCIQCYRCARFYQEYAGGTDFGPMGRAAMVYFGRHQDGPLESPFSGNLVDICPTGVFTDKTARFRARYWDYDMAPSICPHCSLGCATIPMARYRELLKVVARRNDRVNGWFICDRGRFGNARVNATERPRQARIDGQPASLEQALDTLVERLSGFLELYGPDQLAIVGSPRMSLEGNIMAARLRDTLGGATLSFSYDSGRHQRSLAALDLSNPETCASQEDVRRADLVALAGCDLLAEAPMMALAVRQAWRSGARVFVAGGPPLPQEEGRREGIDLPFDFTNIASLGDVPFNTASRPVIIFGTAETKLETMQSAPPDTKRVIILDSPNDFGCALLAREHGAVALATALAEGRVRGIISFEADLPSQLPDGITVIGAADWQQTCLVDRAQVFLPTTAWVEQSGTFVNHEGRAQRFNQVMQPGLPIKGLDPAGHPPREFRRDAPGGDVAPSDRIIALLLQRLGDTMIEEPLSGFWADVQGLEAEGDGLVVHHKRKEKP